MTTKLIATASLMVTRDAMTILPATVPVHEIEIQKAVFGEDNVQVLDAQSEPIELEVENESARLEGKYGPDALEKAYGANYKGKIAKAAADAEVKATANQAKK